MEIAILGLGCFWGPEIKFSKLDGVIKTEVGYCGGHNSETNYKQWLTTLENWKNSSPKKISDRFGNVNISLRGRGSIQAAGDEVLWDIDGVTFQSPPLLSINEVVYVEVIKGLAATNKYGSDGAAGVIVVKTSVNASNYDLINSPKNLWRKVKLI